VVTVVTQGSLWCLMVAWVDQSCLCGLVVKLVTQGGLAQSTAQLCCLISNLCLQCWGPRLNVMLKEFTEIAFTWLECNVDR